MKNKKVGDILIREVQVKDSARVLKAFREISRDSRWLLTEPDEVPNSVKKESAFIKKYLKFKNSILLLAEIDGEIVGLIDAIGGLMNRNKHVAGIGVTVLKTWQGKGIGKAMMKYITEWARSVGLTKLKVNVVDKNQIAIKMYKKLGFKKEGVFKREMKIGKRYYNIIVMSKVLRTGAGRLDS